jgi:hypothetical protein
MATIRLVRGWLGAAEAWFWRSRMLSICCRVCWTHCSPLPPKPRCSIRMVPAASETQVVGIPIGPAKPSTKDSAKRDGKVYLFSFRKGLLSEECNHRSTGSGNRAQQ